MQALLFPMGLSAKMVLSVVVGVFLASFADGIAGGGGIISVPAYFLAGLPAHLALGTNKLSACLGTTVSTARYIRNGYVDWRLAAPSVLLALSGSYFGTRLQLAVGEQFLKWLLLIVLPIVAVVVLKQRSFPEERGEIEPGRQMAIVMLASLVIGTYDGFYGPGAGTFLLLALTGWALLDVRNAAGLTKAANLTSNVAALITFILSSNVDYQLGLAGAVCNFIGAYIGSGMVLTKANKIVKPLIIVVLALLFIKIITK